MRWLPRLLPRAAAAGRVSPTARTTASRGFASGVRAHARRGLPAVPPSWARTLRLWSLELKKLRKSRSRRRAVSTRASTAAAAMFRSAIPLTSLARSFVSSKVAALGGRMARAWRTATAGKEGAPSTSYQHDELNLARIQAKLHPLLSRANLTITRRVEWANFMFAFEQKPRYNIKDPDFPWIETPVGFIREKSNFILRQLLRSRRPFIAEFTDDKGNEIFTVRRPFWLINSSIYAEVDGKEIGVVHRRWHLWRRIYDLYSGNRQFAVVENPGFWNWTFTLLDGNDNVVAKINRKGRGIGRELFTDAGQYAILFGEYGKNWIIFGPDDMDKFHVFLPLGLPERAVALAFAVSLDRDCYSRKLGWLTRFLFGT